MKLYKQKKLKNSNSAKAGKLLVLSIFILQTVTLSPQHAQFLRFGLPEALAWADRGDHGPGNGAEAQGGSSGGGNDSPSVASETPATLQDIPDYGPPNAYADKTPDQYSEPAPPGLPSDGGFVESLTSFFNGLFGFPETPKTASVFTKEDFKTNMVDQHGRPVHSGLGLIGSGIYDLVDNPQTSFAMFDPTTNQVTVMDLTKAETYEAMAKLGGLVAISEKLNTQLNQFGTSIRVTEVQGVTVVDIAISKDGRPSSLPQDLSNVPAEDIESFAVVSNIPGLPEGEYAVVSTSAKAVQAEEQRAIAAGLISATAQTNVVGALGRMAAISRYAEDRMIGFHYDEFGQINVETFAADWAAEADRLNGIAQNDYSTTSEEDLEIELLAAPIPLALMTISVVLKAVTKLGPATAKLTIGIEKYVLNDMTKRGWTVDRIKNTIANNVKSEKTVDARINPATGKPNLEEATKYTDRTGNYVVVNDQRGDLVAYSDRFDKDWVDRTVDIINEFFK